MASHLKEATREDIPLLVSLMDGCYAESGFDLDRERANRIFKAILNNVSLGRVWLIHSRNEYAGYLVVTFVLSMEFGGVCAILDDLYIRTGLRGTGLGQAAMDEIVAILRERGVKAVSVETGKDNLAARTLYTRSGFKPTGRHALRLELASPLRGEK